MAKRTAVQQHIPTFCFDISKTQTRVINRRVKEVETECPLGLTETFNMGRILTNEWLQKLQRMATETPNFHHRDLHNSQEYPILR